jgi:hypothetical protein
MPIIPFTPKRRRFGQNGVVLQILGFFFNEKKKEIKKKKKKKRRNRGGWSHPIPAVFLAKGWSATPYRPYGGGLQPPLAQKMGWPNHPIFGQGVVGHPIPAVWGWPKPPQAFGWSGHPERPKKKKGKKWVWDFGPVGGVRSHPQALGGGSATPKIPNLFFFFFFFCLSGWPDHPQRPGVASTTPIRPVWGGRPPLGQKWGGPATPFFGQGVAPATPISPFFFFFLISFFFSLKKKS